VLADAGKVVAVVALAGGVWVVRNWVESGNPVFPQRVHVFGVTIFDAPFDFYRYYAGHSLLDFLDQPSMLRRFVWPDFNRTWSFGWWLLVAGCLIALARAVRPRHRDARVVAVVVAAIVLAVVYLATPYTALGVRLNVFNVAANTRYAVPALLLATGATAWTAGRLGRAGLVVDVLALAAVADCVRRGYGPVGAKHWIVAAVVVGVVAAGWVAWRRLRPRAWALAGAAATLLVGAAAAGYGAQRRFIEHRYPGIEPPLAFINDQHHHRVGLAGLWTGDGLAPPYPSFGPRLRNRVDFVGPFRRGRLAQYPTPGPFVAALRRGRYDLVLVGLARGPGLTDAVLWPPRAGYREVARSPRLVLFAKGRAGPQG
jgi:hypothetical protein